MRPLLTLRAEAIRQLFQTHGELPSWPAYYSAAPTTALPVAPGEGRRSRAGADEKDGKPSFSTIDASAEGVRTAASYKEPFAKGRRCLVPASGYSSGRARRTIDSPTTSCADGQPLAIAELWDRWRSMDKSETKETFTVVITEPSKFAAQFHNCMPFVLEYGCRQREAQWTRAARASLSGSEHKDGHRKQHKPRTHNKVVALGMFAQHLVVRMGREYGLLRPASE